jgi:hypothetical protein
MWRTVELGLHATKRLWVESTVLGGLARPSAAWFMTGADGHLPDLATFAAAVYLALGRSGRAALREAGAGGTYSEVFRRCPYLLPTLIVFADEPTGAEIRHRYVWLGGPGPAALTDPYTKVERAGRQVGPGLPIVGIMEFDQDMVARAEGSVSPAYRDADTPLLRRVPMEVQPGGTGTTTRIGALCAALGQAGQQWWAGATLPMAREAT